MIDGDEIEFISFVLASMCAHFRVSSAISRVVVSFVIRPVGNSNIFFEHFNSLVEIGLQVKGPVRSQVGRVIFCHPIEFHGRSRQENSENSTGVMIRVVLLKN